MSDKKVYKSKVDWWLAVLIVGLFLLGIGYVIAGVFHTIKSGSLDYWSIITGALVVILIAFLVWPVNYTLTETKLIVRSGILNSKYDFSILTGAAPSRNFLSSPALSLDRLKITYKGKIGFFMISPVSKEEFMKDLASRANHLAFKNGEVVMKF